MTITIFVAYLNKQIEEQRLNLSKSDKRSRVPFCICMHLCVCEVGGDGGRERDGFVPNTIVKY